MLEINDVTKSLMIHNLIQLQRANFRFPLPIVHSEQLHTDDELTLNTYITAYESMLTGLSDTQLLASYSRIFGTERLHFNGFIYLSITFVQENSTYKIKMNAPYRYPKNHLFKGLPNTLKIESRYYYNLCEQYTLKSYLSLNDCIAALDKLATELQSLNFDTEVIY